MPIEIITDVYLIKKNIENADVKYREQILFCRGDIANGNSPEKCIK